LLHKHGGVEQVKIHGLVHDRMANEVKSILDKSPQLINARDKNVKTSLHHAVEVGSMEMLNLLIKSNAQIDATLIFDTIITVRLFF